MKGMTCATDNPDVPFRLLGFAADPDKASTLCGGTFARYAAAGTEVTLVCAGPGERNGADHAAIARQLGAGNLVLLDYRLNELSGAALEAIFADVIQSVRPHVVVAEGSHSGIREATTSAFSTVRRRAGGSAALPAKLYIRASGAPGSVAVTTAIAVAAPTPELFVRVFPDPWVTGVLERDLFAGLSADPGTAATLADRLAS
jgi:LmbE family N-acetylglucosaminyl deacetylase